MKRDEVWFRTVEAAIRAGLHISKPISNTHDAVQAADKVLEEYDRRFPSPKTKRELTPPRGRGPVPGQHY